MLIHPRTFLILVRKIVSQKDCTPAPSKTVRDLLRLYQVRNFGLLRSKLARRAWMKRLSKYQAVQHRYFKRSPVTLKILSDKKSSFWFMKIHLQNVTALQKKNKNKNVAAQSQTYHASIVIAITLQHHCDEWFRKKWPSMWMTSGVRSLTFLWTQSLYQLWLNKPIFSWFFFLEKKKVLFTLMVLWARFQALRQRFIEHLRTSCRRVLAELKLKLWPQWMWHKKLHFPPVSTTRGFSSTPIWWIRIETYWRCVRWD